MNTQTKPIFEINRQEAGILSQKLGVVDAIRFLNQFSTGCGDYTKEREKWLKDISINGAISQMKKRKKRES